MVEPSAEREHTFTPISSMERRKTDFSGSMVLRDIATPTGSLFRPESGLLDQSYAITQSIDNLAKQLDKSRSLQEGDAHTEKFDRVTAETRALEAKIEAMKQRASEIRPSFHRTASCDSSCQYLEWEKRLEDEMSAIQTEMGLVKEEVEDLNSQVKMLVQEEDA